MGRARSQTARPGRRETSPMGGSVIRRPGSVLSGLASPGLKTRTIQEIEDELKEKPWERIQANAFLHWMNHQLKAGGYEEVDDIQTAFKSGVALHNLLETMSDNDQQLRPIRQNPKMKIQEIENINICLQFLKKEGVNLVNIDASDIWDGKLSSILAVVWNMVLKYQVSDNHRKSGDMREFILKWAGERVAPYELEVKNFGDAFSDGKIFAALIASIDPYFDYDFAIEGNDPEETMAEVFAHAEEQMGLPAMLNPADVVEFQEEKSIATYCAYLFDLYGQAPLVLPNTNLHFEVSGDGLEVAEVGSRACFRINVLDRPEGEPVADAGANLALLVEGPDEEEEEEEEEEGEGREREEEIKVVSLAKNSFADFYYVPLREGAHLIEVSYCGEVIIEQIVEATYSPMDVKEMNFRFSFHEKEEKEEGKEGKEGEGKGEEGGKEKKEGEEGEGGGGGGGKGKGKESESGNGNDIDNENKKEEEKKKEEKEGGFSVFISPFSPPHLRLYFSPLRGENEVSSLICRNWLIECAAKQELQVQIAETGQTLPLLIGDGNFFEIPLHAVTPGQNLPSTVNFSLKFGSEVISGVEILSSALQRDEERDREQRERLEREERERERREKEERERKEREREEREKEERDKEQRDKEQRDKEQRDKEQRDKEQRDKEEKEKREKEQREKEQREKEQREKEQKEKEQREKEEGEKEQGEKDKEEKKGEGEEGQEREEQERKERERKEQEEQEKKEREREKEREQREKEEREQKEREQKEREQKEKEQKENEQREKEEKEMKEKEGKGKKENEEKDEKEKEEREKKEKEKGEEGDTQGLKNVENSENVPEKNVKKSLKVGSSESQPILKSIDKTIVVHLGSGDSFMEHLGLTNTKKILPIQENTTARDLFHIMLKRMARVNDPYHKKLVEEHCVNYRFWIANPGEKNRLIRWEDWVFALRGHRILFAPAIGKVLFNVEYSTTELLVNEKFNVVIIAKNEKGEFAKELEGELEAFFTGPSKNVSKYIPEKVVNKDGYFVVPFQTDVPGVWRGMVRFNGVNVQPRSSKLKVVKRKNRFQVSIQNVKRGDEGLMTRNELEKLKKRKEKPEEESVDLIPGLKRGGHKKLHITVVKGVDLLAKNHATNTSNPYVRVTAEGKQKRKTAVIKSSTAPQFRCKCELDLMPCLAPKPGASVITLKVMHAESGVGGDAFLGQTTFNLSKNKLPFRGNLYLGSEKGEVNKKITGYLDVKVEVLKG